MGVIHERRSKRDRDLGKRNVPFDHSDGTVHRRLAMSTTLFLYLDGIHALAIENYYCRVKLLPDNNIQE